MRYSKIEWCDHTFNPWMGCARVSPGCVHCYAEQMIDKHYGKAKWGVDTERIQTGPASWARVYSWNKEHWLECKLCGWRGTPADRLVHDRNCPGVTTLTRARVFCGSIMDVFEDNRQLANWRGELFKMIAQTRRLDWLLLTKRAERIFSLGTDAAGQVFDLWLADNPHVWLGVSVEDQKRANNRIPHLLKTKTAVTFLSVEPMLEGIDLADYRSGSLDWVICGGESGPATRPMDIEWARDLRDQCRSANIPFFMKQLGGYPDKRNKLADLPHDLQIRQFPRKEPNAIP